MSGGRRVLASVPNRARAQSAPLTVGSPGYDSGTRLTPDELVGAVRASLESVSARALVAPRRVGRARGALSVREGSFPRLLSRESEREDGPEEPAPRFWFAAGAGLSHRVPFRRVADREQEPGPATPVRLSWVA